MTGKEELIRKYEARIREARPDLVIQDIVLNCEGLVNDVIIINNDIVFRFGKREWAAADLSHEANCLKLASKHSELRLPAWTMHGPDFISYRKIPGVPLQRYDILRWSERDQEAIAEQLGRFLHQLHSIPQSDIEAHDIGYSATVRRPQDWLKLYNDIEAELFPILMETSRVWVRQHFAPILNDSAFMHSEERFINGDIGSYHLLVDPEARLLNGIIDFGTAGVGDAACDFACLIDSYGESFVRRVARSYPHDLTTLIDRARFWAGTLELQWLLGGLREPEEPSWFAVHIGRARDMLPIGSRWID